jgi:hypothetical protein
MSIAISILFFLAAILDAQGTHPCDAPAPPTPVVAANTPFRIQGCQPAGEVVEGVDVSLDNGPVATYTPTDLGTGTSGLRGWQVVIPSGLAVGGHTVRLTAWNIERDTRGAPTGRKRYASPIVLELGKSPAPAALGDRQYSPALAVSLQVAAPKFTVGQAVQAWQCDSPDTCTNYGNGAASRPSPSMTAPIDGVHDPGAKGIIMAGPTPADGFIWWQVNFSADPDGWSTETNLVLATAAVDCAGTWSEWSAWSAWVAINATTEQRSRSRTFAITQEPSGGGAICPASPEVQTETRPIESAPAPGSAPSATACRWTLRAEPPDATTGWRAQWRQNGVNVGNRDNSPPYERNVGISGGTVSVDVEWSKTIGLPLLSAPRVLVCSADTGRE